MGLLVAAIAWRAWRSKLAKHFIPALVLLSVSVAVGFVVNQPGSLERFYTFAFLPIVYVALGTAAAFIALLESAVAQSLNRLFGLAAALVVAVLGAASTAYWTTEWLKFHGRGLLAERAAFTTGMRSFQQALTYVHYRRDEKGWPRRDLSDECLGIRDALAEESKRTSIPPRVWTITFLQESGCHVMPGVRIQMEFSVAFGNRWHAIVFGPPEAALSELQRIGVHYFYVNLADFNMSDLSAVSTSVFGCLAYSPLFDSARMREHARIVWRRGQAYLLTFDESPVRERLSAEFLQAWRHKVLAPQHGLGDMPGLCARLARYYDAQQERWPVHADDTLPKLKGWQ
jgi:hypothetical protein